MTLPARRINQTISFSDFVSWRHTSTTTASASTSAGSTRTRSAATIRSGPTPSPGTRRRRATAKTGRDRRADERVGFADFLLGLPQSTAIQAGLYKIYLRENVYDGYVNDDWRVKANITLNYGLALRVLRPLHREEQPACRTSIHNAELHRGRQRAANGVGALSRASFNSAPHQPGPHHVFAALRHRVAAQVRAEDRPRPGGARRLRHQLQHRAVCDFARRLSHQAPFADTQTNTLTSGCTTLTPSTTPNMTLANGFGCSSATEMIQNNSGSTRTTGSARCRSTT